MTSTDIFWHGTRGIVPSIPRQAGLLICLGRLILWRLYFTNYPPVDDATTSGSSPQSNSPILLKTLRAF